MAAMSGGNLGLRFVSSSLLNVMATSSCFINAFSFLTHEQTRKHTSTPSLPPNSINQQPATFYLHLLRRCENIESLNQLQLQLVKCNLIKDEFLVEEVIRLCFHMGIPEQALSVFKTVEKPSLFLQNSMIRRLSDTGFYDDLLSLYSVLQKSGCGSDHFTFPFVIKACAMLSALQKGKEIHCLVLRSGFDHNLIVQTALFNMYAKNGDMETAHRIFDGMSQRDLVSWNALLSGYSLNGLNAKAFEVFGQIQAIVKPNVSTFVSIIPVCTRLKALEIGRSFHAFGFKCGVISDESLVSALISMYGACGDLSVARKMFELLFIKSVVSWNAMISAYAHNKKSDEAFEIFRLMVRANVSPNLVTLVSVLPSCGDVVSIRYGESIHTCGIKYGFDQRVSVDTALLSVYMKLGDLDAAQFLFHRMSNKNLLSWNSMVSGFIQNGLWSECLNSFHEMQLAGIKPDSVSILSVLSACARSQDLLRGESAHAFSIRNGFDLDVSVTNALLSLYGDCEKLSTSFKLFRRMTIRNIISWNTLISGCVRSGDTGTAITTLCQMQEEDVKFDLVTLISVLPAFCQAENLLEGMSVHGQAIRIGYHTDVSLVNSLVTMYVNCGALEAGRLLFDGMPFRSVVSWNALMTGYRNHNLFKDVIDLFHQMKIEDQMPNSVTLLNILPICQSQLQGKSIQAYAVRTSCMIESSLLTSLMSMYARFGNIKSCCLLFEMADKSNVVVWNAMMSVNVKSKHAEKTIYSFREMLRMRIEPDYVTILALLSACVQLGCVDFAQCVSAYIICKGFESDIFVTNSLIDMYARCGNLSIAKELFNGMEQKDSVSWSVMINGYGIHGDGDSAIDLISQMKCSGVEPDSITFIGVLSACSHAGLVDEGRILFNSMTQEYLIQPRIEHYACMVDLLGRMGHLNEAYDLVKQLPFKPSISILESLLGACSTYGNIKLGEEVGKLLIELGPENSQSYVILSNIYAAGGRWTDACRLRSEMEERRLRKIPGFSLVEVNGS